MLSARPRALSSRSRLGLGLLACLLATAGCDKLIGAIENKAEEVAADAASPTTPGADAASADAGVTEDEKLSNKLGLYIECTNRSSQRIRDSWQRYSEYVKEDGTPRNKGQKPFLYKIDTELTPCEEAVQKAPTAEPPLPEFDKAMATYLEQGKAFAATTVALDTYYEQENYEDDAWAKGKELAPGFAASFAAWAKADEELDALVDARKEEVDRKVLALVEERKGKNIEYYSRSYLIEAKAFVECASELGEAMTAAKDTKAKAPKPEPPKLDACDAHFTAMDSTGTAFRVFYDANKVEAEKVFWMSSFQSSVDESLAEAKKVHRALAKGSVDTDQLNKLIEEYNGLISDSNNLRFEG